MKQYLPRILRDRRRGLALIIVVTTISLISVLVVAIFSVTRTEYKATQGFVSARSAKQLGDIATAIVQAQITNAHNTGTSANGSQSMSVYPLWIARATVADPSAPHNCHVPNPIAGRVNPLCAMRSCVISSPFEPAFGQIALMESTIWVGRKRNSPPELLPLHHG